MLHKVFLAALLAAGGEASSAASRSAVGHIRTQTSLLRIRGGAEPSNELLSATFAANRLYASVLSEVSAEAAGLRKTITNGEAVPNFGAKVDAVLTDAEEKFAAGTPEGNGEVTALYKAKAEELSAAAAATLEPVFVQQISLLKDSALEQFKKALVGDGDGAEAAAQAEAAFAREAGASSPSKTGWNSKADQASLSGIMSVISEQAKKATSTKLQAAQQLQTAMSYLQMQQQQMQAMQAQFTGGQGGKWNLGAAYRPPDSNINLSGSYQQGRANVQVSLVPDEGAGLLGQNGFTQGVGPANLGLSFNIHI